MRIQTGDDLLRALGLVEQLYPSACWRTFFLTLDLIGRKAIEIEYEEKDVGLPPLFSSSGFSLIEQKGRKMATKKVAKKKVTKKSAAPAKKVAAKKVTKKGAKK